jgi:hypothetical protein
VPCRAVRCGAVRQGGGAVRCLPLGGALVRCAVPVVARRGAALRRATRCGSARHSGLRCTGSPLTRCADVPTASRCAGGVGRGPLGACMAHLVDPVLRALRGGIGAAAGSGVRPGLPNRLLAAQRAPLTLSACVAPSTTRARARPACPGPRWMCGRRRPPTMLDAASHTLSVSGQTGPTSPPGRWPPASAFAGR